MTEEEKQKRIDELKSQVPTTPSTALTIGEKGKKIKDLLYSMKDELANALPKHITPEKMIRIALTSFNRNAKLLDCTPVSLFACIMQSSQLGLIPDGLTGEAHLIPFKNTKKGVSECQFIIGYRGIVSLAFRSGQIRRFQPRTVYDTDLFEYEFGLNEKLIHVPHRNKVGENAIPKITHFYCVLEFSNGGKMFDVMTVDEVNYVRDTSQNYKFAKRQGYETVWDTYYKEMGMKTVIRRLGKLAPISPEFQTAISLDEQIELGTSQKLDLDLLHSSQITPEMKAEIMAGMETEKEAEEKEELDKNMEVKENKVEATEQGIFDKINKEKKDKK